MPAAPAPRPVAGWSLARPLVFAITAFYTSGMFVVAAVVTKKVAKLALALGFAALCAATAAVLVATVPVREPGQAHVLSVWAAACAAVVLLLGSIIVSIVPQP